MYGVLAGALAAAAAKRALDDAVKPKPLVPSSTVGQPVPDFGSLRFSSEPIIAWRTWYVLPAPRPAGAPHGKHRRYPVQERYGFSLASFNTPVYWPPRQPMRAHCLAAWRKRGASEGFVREPHTAPHLMGMCGIYAVKEMETCKRWGHSKNAPIIWGRVALWGRVLEFEDGYRAEYAYPAELWVLPREPVAIAGGSATVWDEIGLQPDSIARGLQEMYGVPAYGFAPSPEG